MTRERKLAIEMWEEIRDNIRLKGESFSSMSICKLKSEFEKRYRIYWDFNCWFCQYVRRGSKNHKTLGKNGCNHCPIATDDAKYDSRICGCSNDSLWETVNDYYLSKDVRIEACNKIIMALEGKKI